MSESQQPAQQHPAAPGVAAGAQPPPASSSCPQHVLAAIYGKRSVQEKRAELDKSLSNWWEEYAERKNDEEHEYVANSLLYDKRQLPRTAPPPDSVAPQPRAATPLQPQPHAPVQGGLQAQQQQQQPEAMDAD